MTSTLTPSERSIRAAIASHTSWGRTADRTARTSAARAAADRRFYDEALAANPELTGRALDAAAASLRSAYFLRLSLRSAQARRRRSAQADDVPDSGDEAGEHLDSLGA